MFRNNRESASEVGGVVIVVHIYIWEAQSYLEGIVQTVKTRLGHYKKKIVIMWGWVLTRLILVIILQYVHIWHHYAVLPKLL